MSSLQKPGNYVGFEVLLADGRKATVPAFAMTDAGGNLLTGATALPAGTDRSGAIAAGGVAQDVSAANASRQGLTFQNTSDTVMRLTENGADAAAATGYSVAAGASVNVSTNRRISVFCAVAGKTFAATEY